MKKLRFLSIVLACIYAFCFSSAVCFAETDEIMYGDANCDNEVDIRDVTALNQHLVGMNELSEQGIKNCDFFCNNEITVQSLLNLKKKVIRTVSSLEPLAYYQITDEEIQEYLNDHNWLVMSYDDVAAINVIIPIEYCSDFYFKINNEDFFIYEHLGLPEEIVRYCYPMNCEYCLENGTEKEGIGFFLSFYNSNSPENLARIYLAIKKEIAKKPQSSLYQIDYDMNVY